MLRKVEEKDFLGHGAPKRVNAFSCNVIEVEFEDGYILQLWAEDAVNTPAGSIPGIFVEDASFELNNSK